jgi:uncharacterized Zn-binding protein involved in type VI secretion
MSVAEMGLIKGTPRPNAARLFINWLLSKEGQIAQYYASKSVPIHKGLQRREFIPFADEILGKKIAPRTIALMNNSIEDVKKVWDEHWAAGTGLGKVRTVNVKIISAKRRGRIMQFAVGDKKHKVSVSGRRTKVTINGKRAKRSKVKSGMTCAVTYRGDGDEAKSIACK